VRRIFQIAICLAGLWLLGSWLWQQPHIRDLVHRAKARLNPTSNGVPPVEQPGKALPPELPPQAEPPASAISGLAGDSKAATALDGLVSKLRSSVAVLNQELPSPRLHAEQSTESSEQPTSLVANQFKEGGERATGPEDFGRLWRKLQQNHQMLTQP
jgi:hypothetical protein